MFGRKIIERNNKDNGKNPMTKLFQNFAREEDGATMIEYGLIAALVSIASIAVLTAIGPKLVDTFTSVSNALPTP